METYKAVEERVNERLSQLEQVSSYAYEQLKKAIGYEGNIEGSSSQVDFSTHLKHLYEDFRAKITEVINAIGINISGYGGDKFPGRGSENTNLIASLMERYFIHIQIGEAAAEGLFQRKSTPRSSIPPPLTVTHSPNDTTNDLKHAALVRLFKYTEIQAKAKELATLGRYDLIIDALDATFAQYPRPAISVKTPESVK